MTSAVSFFFEFATDSRLVSLSLLCALAVRLFVVCLRSVGHQVPRHAALFDMIRRHDGDRDGTISFAEFVELVGEGELPSALVTTQQGALAQPQLGQQGGDDDDYALADVAAVFRLIDADGSGTVDVVRTLLLTD